MNGDVAAETQPKSIKKTHKRHKSKSKKPKSPKSPKSPKRPKSPTGSSVKKNKKSKTPKKIDDESKSLSRIIKTEVLIVCGFNATYSTVERKKGDDRNGNEADDENNGGGDVSLYATPICVVCDGK